MKKSKVAVYLSENEKEIIKNKADSVNQSISSYLLNIALGKTIDSSQIKSKVASTACQIYRLADTLESTEQRTALKRLAVVSSQEKWAKFRHKVYQCRREVSPGSIPAEKVR